MVIINNGSLNISATVADSSSGSSALTVSGAGKLTLSGQNTYTGVTRPHSGIVNMGSAEQPRQVPGPLGASPASNPGSIVFNGGTLQYSANNQNDYSGRFSTAANQLVSIGYSQWAERDFCHAFDQRRRRSGLCPTVTWLVLAP